MVQLLGILPTEGTHIGSLGREDPTGCWAAKHMHHNGCARALPLLSPCALKPVLCNRGSHSNEEAVPRS